MNCLKTLLILILFCLLVQPAADAEESRSVANKQDRKHNATAKVSQDTFSLAAADNYLAWKLWHRRVAKALSKRTKRAAGPNIGTALLRITIYKDRQLIAELLSCSNRKLGSNCQRAAQSLSGEVLLDFPKGSKREEMLFNFEFNNKLFTMPRTEYIKDDLEQVEPENNNNLKQQQSKGQPGEGESGKSESDKIQVDSAED